MSEPAPVAPHAVADLRWVIARALERGGGLLTAGELVVVRRILALEGEAALLYARLSGRRPLVFRLSRLASPDVEDVPAAVAVLWEAGL